MYSFNKSVDSLMSSIILVGFRLARLSKMTLLTDLGLRWAKVLIYLTYLLNEYFEAQSNPSLLEKSSGILKVVLSNEIPSTFFISSTFIFILFNLCYNLIL